MKITRRELFQIAVGTAASALASRFASANTSTRIGTIVPSDHIAASAFRAGAKIGIEEAGAALDLEEAVVETPDEAAVAARDLAASGAFVLGGIGAEYCDAIAKVAPESFLESRARQDLTPGETPIGHLALNPGYQDHARTLVAGLKALGIQRFAVIQPNAVLTASARSVGLKEVQEVDAEVLFTGQANSGADPFVADIVSSTEPGFALPVAWHGSLQRYGAAQLNDRYKAKTGRAMDENAWYGWFGVKIIAESISHGRDLSECRVDGHKGAVLSFSDRRIKQPLYVVVSRPVKPNQDLVNA